MLFYLRLSLTPLVVCTPRKQLQAAAFHTYSARNSSHGPHEADRAQVHRRQGAAQAAGHQGRAQVRARHRRRQEAAQVRCSLGNVNTGVVGAQAASFRAAWHFFWRSLVVVSGVWDLLHRAVFVCKDVSISGWDVALMSCFDPCAGTAPARWRCARSASTRRAPSC